MMNLHHICLLLLLQCASSVESRAFLELRSSRGRNVDSGKGASLDVDDGSEYNTGDLDEGASQLTLDDSDDSDKEDEDKKIAKLMQAQADASAQLNDEDLKEQEKEFQKEEGGMETDGDIDHDITPPLKDEAKAAVKNEEDEEWDKIQKKIESDGDIDAGDDLKDEKDVTKASAEVAVETKPANDALATPDATQDVSKAAEVIDKVADPDELKAEAIKAVKAVKDTEPEEEPVNSAYVAATPEAKEADVSGPDALKGMNDAAEAIAKVTSKDLSKDVALKAVADAESEALKDGDDSKAVKEAEGKAKGVKQDSDEGSEEDQQDEAEADATKAEGDADGNKEEAEQEEEQEEE